MSNLADVFQEIEHVEFAASVQGAEDIDMFFALTRTRAPVQALYVARDHVMVLARIAHLLRQPTDKNFMHPSDPAIAVYLDLLYRIEASDAVRSAWELCQPHATRLYWTNQVAQSVNLRQQSVEAVTADPASEASGAVPADSVSLPMPPPPMTKDEFARVFYADYIASSRARAEAAGQDPPPRPAWDDIPADHPIRLVFQGACDGVFSRLQAVVYVPSPPEDEAQREAVAHAIRDGKLAARMTLLELPSDT